MPAPKIVSTGRGYWSSSDPYSTFGTKAAASAWAKKLSGQKNRSNRTPTTYTMLVGKPNRKTGKFSAYKQGPHTIAHTSVWGAILNARRLDRLDDLFEILDPPERVDEIIDQEFPLDRLKRDLAVDSARQYQKYYNKAGSILVISKGSALDTDTAIQLSHSINKAFSLHPHATYAYKGKGASKKSLRGKGERSDKPVREMIDTGFRFNDPDAAMDIETTADALQEMIDAF